MTPLTPRQVANALRDEAKSFRNQNLWRLLERAAELIEEQIEPQEGDMERLLQESIRTKISSWGEA